MTLDLKAEHVPDTLTTTQPLPPGIRAAAYAYLARTGNLDLADMLDLTQDPDDPA